jgi:hypothetical protein
MTVDEPGVHGATVTGTQGTGVKTPCAAAVAAATWGLLGVVHIPKGITFVIATLSIIVAAGILPVATLFLGKTVKLLGATPKLHIMVAPEYTCCGMSDFLQKEPL